MYWDNYRLAYTGQFDCIMYNDNPTVGYTVNIYKRGVINTVKALSFGSNPAVRRFLNDDYMAPIKGSELILNILVINNSISIQEFYSDDDNVFRVELIENNTSQIEFVGFLNKDDYKENITEKGHLIELSFTDNLGYLKDISFNDAAKICAKRTTSIQSQAAFYLTSQADLVIPNFVIGVQDLTYAGYFIFRTLNIMTFVVGDTLIISGGSLVDGVYTILKADDIGGVRYSYKIYVREQILNTGTFSNASIRVLTPYNLDDKLYLSDFINICLKMTSINLYTLLASKLKVQRLTPFVEDFFSNTFLFGRSFSDNGTFENCYDILEKICLRFNMTLFQSNNAYRFVRWHEARYASNNNIAGYRYDTNMLPLGPQSNITLPITFGPGAPNISNFEEGLIQTINPPIRYAQEVVKFDNVDNILNNQDANEYGEYLSFYRDTVNNRILCKDYKLANWQENTLFGTFTGSYGVIHLEFNPDNTNDIMDSYIGVRPYYSGSNSWLRILSNPIKVEQFTRFNIKFDYYTGITANFLFGIIAVFDVATVPTVHFWTNAGAWSTDPNDCYSLTSNTGQFESADIDFVITNKSNCTIYIAIGNIADVGWKYKNFNLTSVSNYLVMGDNAIGYTNNSRQNKQIKEKDTLDISLDGDSLLYDKIQMYQYEEKSGTTKSYLWQEKGITDTNNTLAYIMTREKVLDRKVARLKIEGTGFPLKISGGQGITAHSILKIPYFATKNFFFGKLEQNYKENNFNFSLYELYDDSEKTDTGVADVTIRTLKTIQRNLK